MILFSRPLTPFMHPERLRSHHLFVAGDKLRASGFACAHPACTVELLAECVQCAIDAGIFPPFEGMPPSSGAGGGAASK